MSSLQDMPSPCTELSKCSAGATSISVVVADSAAQDADSGRLSVIAACTVCIDGEMQALVDTLGVIVARTALPRDLNPVSNSRHSVHPGTDLLGLTFVSPNKSVMHIAY